MTKQLCFSLLFLLLQIHGYGQQCGTDEYDRYRKAHDPAYAQERAQWEEGLQQYRQARSTSRVLVSGSDTAYEFPLVLHVMHTGQALGHKYNPSDAQLTALVDYVNKCYEARWPYYPDSAHGGVRTHIQFVLAKTDPNCNPTNGIVRVNASSVPQYATGGVKFGSSGAPIASLMKFSHWPADRYLNVWIVTYINGPVVGFADYPTSKSQTTGGAIVIDAESAYAGTDALVHELGHALNLMHTFEGDNGGGTCPPLNDCGLTGDRICDTEPCKRLTECTPGRINTCTNVPFAGVQFNFMSYSPCTDRFTPNQRDAMLRTVETLYYNLVKSNTSQPPLAVVVRPACVPFASANPNPSTNQGVTAVYFNTISRESGGFGEEDSMTYVDMTCLYSTRVIAGNSYPITINNNVWQQEIKVYLDYNNDGVFQQAQECVYQDTGFNAQISSTHTGVVTIPHSGIVTGVPLRMRVISEGVTSTAPSPCSLAGSGQAEDYSVIIDENTAVSAPVSVVKTIYPNPAANEINVNLNRRMNGSLQLFNSCGQLLRSSVLSQTDRTSIPVSDLSNGLYQLKLTDEKGTSTMGKVIVMH